MNLDTWIISDTHFFHDNIVKYCNRPVDHTEIILNNWLDFIQPDDTVLHLGDIFMGRGSEVTKLLPSLPGQKFFIRGNHDKKGIHWYRDGGFQHVGEVTHNGTRIINAASFITDENKRVLFTHFPDTQFLDKWDINIHGHIHNNGYSSSVPTDRDYRNVSVEVNGYRPWKLRDIIYGEDGVSFQSRLAGGTAPFDDQRKANHG